MLFIAQESKKFSRLLISTSTTTIPQMFSEFGLAVLLISILVVLINHNENPETLSNELNTTVVILNWSRIANVKQIVSNVCDHLLDDTVANIIIWNNNPTPLALKVCLNLPSFLQIFKDILSARIFQIRHAQKRPFVLLTRLRIFTFKRVILRALRRRHLIVSFRFISSIGMPSKPRY